MITTDSWVLETVQGLQLNFLSPPFQSVPPLEASHSEESWSLIKLEIQDMLEKGAIHMVPFTWEGNHRFISSLFLVPKKGGGQRPVVNVRPLNQLKVPLEKGRKWLFLTDLCFSWVKMDPVRPSYYDWVSFSPGPLFRRRTLGVPARKIAKTCIFWN